MAVVEGEGTVNPTPGGSTGGVVSQLPDKSVVEEIIISKALKCIDEVYPSGDTFNDTYFPVADFLMEAVRWVIDVVPTRHFKYRNAFPSTATIRDGVVTLSLPDDFGRLVTFRLSDWNTSVTRAIYDTDALYRQQGNRVLRGNPSRPIVVITGKRTIEAYSTRQELSGFYILGYYIPYDSRYIYGLEDIVAWKLAEIVLQSMSDSASAAVCSARANELLQQLSL